MQGKSPTEPSRWRRSWWRPRFTLGMLLGLVTLCAIGAWYWWRLPYEVEHTGLSIWRGIELVVVDAPQSAGKNAHPGQARHVKNHLQIVTREVESVHRLWGGKTLRHGEVRDGDNEGRVVSRVTYREGVEHGRSVWWYSDGHVREEGEYRLGRRQGTWTTWRQVKEDDREAIRYVRATSSWLDGVPHGVWQWYRPDGTVAYTFKFNHGRLVQPEAPEADQRLAELLTKGAIDDPQLVTKLLQPVELDFAGVPLKDGLQHLINQTSTPIAIGFRRGSLPKIQPDTPITCKVEGAPLFVALGKVLRPLGIACDYRYGMLMIDDAESIAAWRDTTGVTRLIPPRDSNLAAVWEEPVDVSFIEQPLNDACLYLRDRLNHRVQFDLSGLPPTSTGQGFYLPTRDVPVTADLRALPLRHCLGIVLDRIGCQAKLDGETIVIEPQSEAAEH